MSEWDRSSIEILIECYREYPCLYNNKDKDYYNKHARREVLMKICEELNKNRKGNYFQIADLIKKFNALRTVFGVELKKIRNSVKFGIDTDQIYKPNVWWFPMMTFLEEYMNPRPSYGALKEELQTTVDEFSNDTNLSHGEEDMLFLPSPEIQLSPGECSRSSMIGPPASNEIKKRKNDDDNNYHNNSINHATTSTTTIYQAASSLDYSKQKFLTKLDIHKDIENLAFVNYINSVFNKITDMKVKTKLRHKILKAIMDIELEMLE